MAIHDDGSALPYAASEREWSRVLGVSRDTLRAARERGELRAARPGLRRLLILRDGPRGVLEWLDGHALGDGDNDSEAKAWAAGRVAREETRRPGA